MSSQVKTFLINDNRISGITDEIVMPVKRGPASSTIQGYRQVSNSSSSINFNVSVPSENTLINRNIRVNAKLQMTATFGANATGAAITFSCVPSSFPLNTGINSVIALINNTKVSVSTQDVLAVLLKQYDQEFLAKHVQTTPSYVDKYWGSLSDAANDEFPSSYFSGVKYAEKDSNVSARADSNVSFVLYSNAGAVVANNQIPNNAPAGYYADITITVSEPLLGLPTYEMKDHEACYIGVNNLDLTLQLNDCKHVLYFPPTVEALIASRGPGLKHTNSSTFFSDDSKLTINYLTLHASDYAKMMPKNVIPYNEFENLKTSASIDLTKDASALVSDQKQLRQIPDKIYISVTPTYSNLPTTASNHLSFPITNLSITFNNRANLLSEMDQYDLYTMSRRNGSHQSYQEFRGVVRDYNGSEYLSLGSIIVIDPRDLSLDDYLSSGSIGQFSLQAQLTVGKLHSNTVFGVNTVIGCQINMIASYAGVLVTQQGSSASMSGLLTKNLVLETKEAGNSLGDYEEVAEVSGGNIGRSLTALGNAMNRKGRKMIRNKLDSATDKIEGSGYSMSAGSYQMSGGKSRLSKYM